MKRLVAVAAGGIILAGTMLLAAAAGPFADAGSGGTGADPSHRSVSPLAPSTGANALDRTISSLQATLRANPADWRASASLGLAYLQKARLIVNPAYYTKAEQSLRSSLRTNRTGNLAALIGHGILAGARHDFLGELRWGRAAERVSPYGPDAKGVVVDALVELGRYGAAGDELQRMVDLRPDLASFARVSYFRELNGDLPGAIEAMKQAFDAVGGVGPDAAWASHQLGDLYFATDRLGAAAFAYHRAAYLQQDYWPSTAGLAKVAAARGSPGRAIALLRRVVRSYPAPAYVIALGDLYRSTGDRRRAASEYALVRAEQRLFAANGVRPDVEVLNFCSDHSVRTAWALRVARREFALRPSVRVADALSWALYANGRPQEAVRYSRKALALGTRDASYRFHAGMIAAATGHPSRARSYLRSALRLNPHFSVLDAPQARRALRTLE